MVLHVARDRRLLVRGSREVVAEPTAAVDHLLARALGVRDVLPWADLRRADGGDVRAGRGKAWERRCQLEYSWATTRSLLGLKIAPSTVCEPGVAV